MGAIADSPRRAFHAYLASVSTVGAGVLVVTAADRLPQTTLHRSTQLGVLVALLIMSELYPIEVATPSAKSSVTISGVFACALLMRWDWTVAVAAMAVASVVNDASHRVAWWKATFNVGQYTLALAGAGLLVDVLHGRLGASEPLDARHFAVALAAGAVFFLLNNTLTGVALALWDGLPILPFLRGDFPLQVSVNGAVVALAPVLIAVTDASPWLAPILFVPLIALHRSAQVRLELHHHAQHDVLTGLPNQVMFREVLAESVARAEATGAHVGVVMVDLDHFSEINDTLGHATGDELLKQVAARLVETASGGATVTRFAGDHFAVVCPDLSSPWEASELAERLRGAFERPLFVEGSPFELSVNVGLSAYPHHSRDIDRLVQYADVAMNVAKQRRVGHEIYSAVQNSYTPRRLAIVGHLRQALLRHELAVHYQPKVNTHSGSVLGLEALLRWQNRDLGAVSPDEFIPLAEHTGLIREVTAYVLEEALRQLSEWRSAGCPYSVSVNLSARDLHDLRLPGMVARRLAVWGVPASALVLEITETTVMSDLDRAVRVLRELSEMQIGISVDDYGTGYSSLVYLTRLPVDEIKIDRSFVSGMGESDRRRVVVRSTIELARSLGLRVVAEGVETDEEWQLLAAYGCTAVQGLRVGAPVPGARVCEALVGGVLAPAPRATTDRPVQVVD